MQLDYTTLSFKISENNIYFPKRVTMILCKRMYAFYNNYLKSVHLLCLWQSVKQ